jgi:hypothetical protein
MQRAITLRSAVNSHLEDPLRDIIDGFLRFQREVYPQRV